MAKLVSRLEFNIPFQHKYGYITDKRSGVESYPKSKGRPAIY